MTNKKPWKRNVRNLYLFLLGIPDYVKNVDKAINFFHIFWETANEAKESPDCPKIVKKSFITYAGKKEYPEMPQYLKWAKKYLYKEEEK